ncbi:helix-turn-helix domain-containing protein [Pseudoclavibacter sp. 13-3]|uniref:helix-turn-helix domain-containing protein n=1 Tax=Pseudoclavibacter sp. 13-3 TaxID=2901228 RepID=UPI001E364470|nr:PucR family transcriptional regulator [Pseudoclavibacter sp. 13-3]MCD7100934.1 PucR family transcriptional regulator [Pseudoclavibacter sp. 13-3]
MSVTIRRLLGIGELSLRTIVGDEAGAETSELLDAALDWVYSSNLVDPMRFLPAGQMLLTDGAQFGVARFDYDAYVARLRDGGLVGVGLGTGLTWTEPPEGLVDACRRHGLPLVEVPYHVPFLAVIRKADDLLDSEHQQHIQWGLDAQRAISRAALRSNRLGDLLQELAKQLDCGVAIFDSSGQIMGSARQRPLPHLQLQELTGAMERLTRSGTRSAARISADGAEFIVQTIGAPPKLAGMLVLSGVSRLDGVQLDVVESVLALTGITLEFNRTINQQRHVLRDGVIEIAASGSVALANRLAERLWNEALPTGERAVVALIDSTTALVDALDRMQRDGMIFWGLRDGRATIVSPTENLDSVLEVCLRERVRAGISQLSTSLPLSQLIQQARRVVADADAGSIARYDDLADAGWPTLLRGSMLEVVAAQLLAPLDQRHESEGVELRRTLRIWLEENGQAEAAAARLGVHRHTVRNRVARAASLLDLDLDTFEARTKVWLALSAADEPHDPSAAAEEVPR